MSIEAVVQAMRRIGRPVGSSELADLTGDNYKTVGTSLHRLRHKDKPEARQMTLGAFA